MPVLLAMLNGFICFHCAFFIIFVHVSGGFPENDGCIFINQKIDEKGY